MLSACSFDENNGSKSDVKDQQKQKEYAEKLESLFDISLLN